MKKLLASLTALILIAFIFSSCSDSGITEDSSASTPSTKGTFSTDVHCANNYFPDYSWGATDNMSYKECAGDPEGYISGRSAAYLWSQYVTVPSGVMLGYLACGGFADGVKAVSSLSLSFVGNHPKLTWSFVYSHYYIVQRKIDSGSWTQIAKIGNKGVMGSYSYPASNMAEYTDNSIDISNFSSSVYYRVFAQSFDENSSSSSVVSYVSSLAAAIGGTSSIMIPPKGSSNTYTWTSTVTGGTAPYTYSWHFGSSTGTSSSFTYTTSYQGYDADTYDTLTLTVTDAASSSVTVTRTIFQDSYPYEP
jgi:hypothetical protein